MEQGEIEYKRVDIGDRCFAEMPKIVYCMICGQTVTECQGTCIQLAVDCCVCTRCKESPCVFLQGESLVTESLDSFISAFPNENDDNIPANLIRKKAYCFYAYFLFGHLGRKRRVRLPECVVDGVRALWPNPMDPKLQKRARRQRQRICTWVIEMSEENMLSVRN